jgi:hypothetical protein
MAATYRTLCATCLITMFGTYSGCAMMLSFTDSSNTSPNEPGATLDVLSVVSLRVAPETPASYPRCSTGGWAYVPGTGASASVIKATRARAPAGEALARDRATGSEPPEIAPDRDGVAVPRDSWEADSTVSLPVAAQSPFFNVPSPSPAPSH